MKRAALGVMAGLFLFIPAAADTVTLGVDEAIGRAVETNLKTRLARERVREAEATLDAAYAALAPRLSVQASQFNRSVNLASQGLSGDVFPIPNRIGPFYSFSSNLELMYRVYDRTRTWDIRSQQIERELAEIRSDQERRVITALTSATYITLLEAQERAAVSRADLELARRLVEQATNQEEAGIAAGIDVTRARTRMAERELDLQQISEQIRRTQRELLRLTGLPLTDELDLSDQILHIPNPFPDPEASVEMALRERLEVRMAAQEVALAESRMEKAASGDAPTVDLVADAGFAGNTPFQNSTFVHNVGLNLNLPLFDGGLTRAESEAARSRVEQARLEQEDLTQQIESDVRDAYSLLSTSEQSLETAERAIELAGQELEMARDRFDAGLTDNVEVLASEAALTRARYSRLEALANYDLGLIRLASASGRPDLLLEAFHRATSRKGNVDE